MQQTQEQTLHTPLREPIKQSTFKALQRRILVPIFRQLESNPELHVFVMKIYVYADSFAATLKQFKRLVQDSEFISKVERHLTDEEKHIRLFSQRIVELGGTPDFTPNESDLSWIQSYIAQLDLLHTEELGISRERLNGDKMLEMPEIIRFLVFVQGQEEQGAAFFAAHFQALDKDIRTKEVLAEVLQDEERHVAYLTEELDKLGREGFQPLIDEARWRCRKVRRSIRLPIGEALSLMPMVLEEKFHFRPVGMPATVLWFLLRTLSGIIRAARGGNSTPPLA